MKMMIKRVSLVLLFLFSSILAQAQSSDNAHWPQWRGPNRDGISKGNIV